MNREPADPPSTGGGNAVPSKIERAKLRWAQRTGGPDIARNAVKGKPFREKLDRAGVLDVAGRPELRKKVAKLDGGSARIAKMRAAVTSSRLPAKIARDSAVRLDFRKSGENIGKSDIRRASLRSGGGGGPKSSVTRSSSTTTAYKQKWNRLKDQRSSAREYARGGSQGTVAGKTGSKTSGRRIVITDDDLKKADSKFRSERSGAPKSSESRATRKTEESSRQWTTPSTRRNFDGEIGRRGITEKAVSPERRSQVGPDNDRRRIERFRSSEQYRSSGNVQSRGDQPSRATRASRAIQPSQVRQPSRATQSSRISQPSRSVSRSPVSRSRASMGSRQSSRGGGGGQAISGRGSSRQGGKGHGGGMRSGRGSSGSRGRRR